MHSGRKLNEDHKKKISRALKLSQKFQIAIKDKERSLKLSRSLKGRIFTKEWKKKISISRTGILVGNENPAKRPEVRKKIAELKRGIPRPQYLKYILSKNMKQKWREDKVFVEKWIKSQNLKPNKKEKFLIDFFEKHNFPFRYVGDFKILIDGKCPDFIEEKNKKIIEFFGNHWHTQNEEKERINHFKNNGFDCLIIWQNELEDKNLLFNKIKTFVQRPIGPELDREQINETISNELEAAPLIVHIR